MRPWTESEEKELKRLLALGLSWRDIALQLGRSRNSIAGKINRLEMIENPTGPRIRPKRKNPRVWDTNHGNWDSRTFLPYREWKMWNRSQRKKREAEGIQDHARPDYTGGNQGHSPGRSPGVREI